MAKTRPIADEMRREYDFSKGIRGRYARRFAEGTNVVVLDADLARRFRTSKAVNRALRAYVAEHAPSRRPAAKRAKKA